MTDEEIKAIALRICKEEGVTYLSHEYHPCFHGPLWIAVEDWAGRWEMRRAIP